MAILKPHNLDISISTDYDGPVVMAAFYSLVFLTLSHLALSFLYSSPFSVLVTSSSMHTDSFLPLLSITTFPLSILYPTVTPSYSLVICLETDSVACFLYRFFKFCYRKFFDYFLGKSTYIKCTTFTHTKTASLIMPY